MSRPDRDHRRDHEETKESAKVKRDTRAPRQAMPAQRRSGFSAERVVHWHGGRRTIELANSRLHSILHQVKIHAARVTAGEEFFLASRLAFSLRLPVEYLEH